MFVAVTVTSLYVDAYVTVQFRACVGEYVAGVALAADARATQPTARNKEAVMLMWSANAHYGAGTCGVVCCAARE